MPGGNDQFSTAHLRNLSQWRQRPRPFRMSRRHLFDKIQMLSRDVAFFPRIGFQIEQLPRVFFILPVQSPILPAHRDQVTTHSIVRLVVQPEQILVWATFFIATEVRDQINTIQMIGCRERSRRASRSPARRRARTAR